MNSQQLTLATLVESGIWLGKILANGICLPNSPVFPCQNFAPYGSYSEILFLQIHSSQTLYFTILNYTP